MLTNSKAISLLNELNGRSATIYLALSTTAPNRDGSNVTEPSSEVGYERVAVRYSQIDGTSYAFTSAAYDESTDSVKTTNQAQIMFPEAKGSWGEITHFAIYASKGATTPIAYGALATSITPTTNQIPVIPVGAAVLEIQ